MPKSWWRSCCTRIQRHAWGYAQPWIMLGSETSWMQTAILKSKSEIISIGWRPSLLPNQKGERFPEQVLEAWTEAANQRALDHRGEQGSTGLGQPARTRKGNRWQTLSLATFLKSMAVDYEKSAFHLVKNLLFITIKSYIRSYLDCKNKNP